MFEREHGRQCYAGGDCDRNRTSRRSRRATKWIYDESDRVSCRCTPGEAGEKELGFVHNAVKFERATCQYCYICQGDEVKWSDDKLRTFMDEDSDVRLGKGDFQHTMDQLEKMLREEKVDREYTRILLQQQQSRRGRKPKE